MAPPSFRLLHGRIATFCFLSLSLGCTQAVAGGEVSLEGWSRTLPFSFKFDGHDSSTLLVTWQRKDEMLPVLTDRSIAPLSSILPHT